jgi:hypothetical protein
MDAATLDKEILDLTKNYLLKNSVSVIQVKKFAEFRAVDREEIAASLKRLQVKGRLVERMAGTYVLAKKSSPTLRQSTPKATTALKAKATTKAKPAKKPKKRTFSDWFWGR